MLICQCGVESCDCSPRCPDYYEMGLRQSVGPLTLRYTEKLLKANEARFRDFLIDHKVMYRLGGTLTAHQNHIDAGRFEVRTGVADSEHAYTSTKFTAKGVDWIAGEWARHQLRVEVAA